MDHLKLNNQSPLPNHTHPITNNILNYECKAALAKLTKKDKATQITTVHWL